MFKNCGDKEFKNYCKKEQTQHQFTFEAIDVSTNFPLGCKMMYRAYCRDKVMEFMLDGDNTEFEEFSFVPQQCLVESFPKAEPEINVPEGKIPLFVHYTDKIL